MIAVCDGLPCFCDRCGQCSDEDDHHRHPSVLPIPGPGRPAGCKFNIRFILIMSIQDYKDKKVLNERLMKNNWAVLSLFSYFAKKRKIKHMYILWVHVPVLKCG